MTRLCVSCVVYDHQTCHILLQHRAKNPGQGLFVLPGGSLEDGEDPWLGIARELSEEIGLDEQSPHLRFTSIDHAFDGEIEGGPLINLYFVCNWDKGLEKNLEPEKCYGLHWFHYNRLPFFQMWKNDRWAIERANRLYYLREMSNA